MIWYMGVTFAASIAIVALTVAHEYLTDKRWESRQNDG